VLRVGHAADLVEPLLVADGHAVVLAEMLGPGGDDELLEDPVGVGGVLPDSPLACPGSAPAEPDVSESGQEIVFETLTGPVLHGQHDRAAGRLVGCQQRLGPVAARSLICDVPALGKQTTTGG
jgi:hypothetical protein